MNVERSAPRGAVFLSYASQDADAARRIADALTAAGIEVWFDRSELRGGDAWDQKIRKQIKDCALFIPVVSANTQARREGYFRLEWKLAEDRTHLMARGTPFLVPVCIDDTKDWDAIVPDSFMTVQWTRLRPVGYGGQAPDDHPLAAFAERVGKLLAGEVAPAAGRPPAVAPTELWRCEQTTDHGPQTRGRATGDRGQAGSRNRWILPVGVAAVVAAAGFLFRNGFNQEPRTRNQEPAPSTAKPLTEAGRLIAQVHSIVEKIGYTRDDLSLAEDLCRRATELEPTLAEAWAARAYVGSTYLNRGWDRTDARARDIQAFASRALALDPNAVEALLAQGMQLAIRGAAITEFEPFLRRAIAAAPNDVRPVRFLGYYFSLRGQDEASAAMLRQAAQVNPRDVLTQYNLATHFAARGELALALQYAEAALALAPDFDAALMLKASLAVRQNGDLVAMRVAIDRIPATARGDDRAVYFAMWTGLLERNLARVVTAAASGTNDYLTDNMFRGPKAWLLALAYEGAGQTANARVQWQAAEAVLRRRSANGAAPQVEQVQLAYTLVWLGQRDEAARLIAPFEMMAREQPSPGYNYQLAHYHAARGDAVAAAPYLRYLLTNLVNGGFGGFTAHLLRLDPEWDKLRGQPAFEELLKEFSQPAGGRGTEDGGRKAEDRKAGGPENPSSRGTREPTDLADAKSVAVLAFANLSDDKDNEYFSDGISEELLNVLAKVPGLKVSARTSAFSFKGKGVAIPEIARQLGVAYVVEGSVRKAGNRVRITAQLIKAADGFHVWSDNFDRELKDIFAVQDEIAGLIATKLSLSLGASPEAKRPVNPEVFRLYLAARQAWNLRNETGYQRAESLLNQALVLDPNFARAHAALSDVWLTRGQDNGTVGSRSQRDGPQMTRLAQAAERAIELEPNSAEARASLGNAFKHQWKLEEAEREFRAAIDLNPNYASAHQWLGRALMDMGRFEAGLAELQRAVELDPLSSRIADNLSDGWLRIGRPVEALQLADRALSLQPDSNQALVFRAMALAHLGRSAEAIQATTGIDRSRWANFIAYVLAVAGDSRGAERELQSSEGRTEARVDESERAGAWFALGRKPEGLAALVPEVIKINNVSRLYSFPVFDPMRDDPRFLKAIADMGVMEYYQRAQAWRASNRMTEDGGRRTDKNGSTSAGSAKEGKAK